jgi:2-polyprenyl-3-methyl-5-hydroxy-6-metoxy-1,4-benzoquinol methylase
MSEPFKYPGNELELFQHATRWKNYFSRVIRPYLKGNVLEAGAGIGSTTQLLNTGSTAGWLLLEPDPDMCRLLEKKLQQQELPSNCRIVTGTITDLTETFDTIIYIDVLEHIQEDKQELHRAAELLNTGGHIIVLSPAFPYLYSPFDKAIGHFRRYTKKMIRELNPAGLHLVSNRYYDSVGYFAALLNKLLLRQKYPSGRQVLFWDRWMVPVSGVTDQLCFHAFGKSIIAVWKK